MYLSSYWWNIVIKFKHVYRMEICFKRCKYIILCESLNHFCIWWKEIQTRNSLYKSIWNIYQKKNKINIIVDLRITNTISRNKFLYLLMFKTCPFPSLKFHMSSLIPGHLLFLDHFIAIFRCSDLLIQCLILRLKQEISDLSFRHLWLFN